MCKAYLLLTPLLLAIAGSVPASGGPIGFQQWYEFGFDPLHSPQVAGCAATEGASVACRPGIGSVFLDSPAWTFTTPQPVELNVTDGLLSGDFFDVFDAGTLIGSTPAVPLGLAVDCGLDPSVCFVTSRISHATFLLPAGSHSLTLDVHPVQVLGEGFFRLDPIPEPGTLALMVLVGALAGVRYLVRSRH